MAFHTYINCWVLACMSIMSVGCLLSALTCTCASISVNMCAPLCVIIILVYQTRNCCNNLRMTYYNDYEIYIVCVCVCVCVYVCACVCMGMCVSYFKLDVQYKLYTKIYLTVFFYTTVIIGHRISNVNSIIKNVTSFKFKYKI